MRTLQQWVKEVDIDELVHAFLLASPPAFWEIKEHGVGSGEAYQRIEDAFRKFISEFLELDAVDNQDKVFFAYPTQVDLGKEAIVNLIYLSEIDNDYVEHYDWMLADRDDLAGYLIADTQFNEENIIEVLADILEEATFFGYTDQSFQERRAEVKQELEESLKSVEQGKTYSLDEVWEHLGLPPRKKDPEEETLRRAMFRAKRHLDIYCRERELNEIRRKMGITEHAIPDVSGENETVKNSENL